MMTQFPENPFALLHQEMVSIKRMLADLGQNISSIQAPGYDPQERISRSQLQKEKSISLGTIHNLMKKGELPYEKVGRKTLFKRQDVEECFRGKKKGGKK